MHELCRLLYIKSEQREKEKEEEERKAEEEKKRNQRTPGLRLPPNHPAYKQQQNRQQPTDVSKDPPALSPLDAEALQDALEEFEEGGI